MKSRSILPLLVLVSLLFATVSASEVEWVSWQSWTTNGTSGSIPFGEGSISVSVSPPGLKTWGGRDSEGFADTSTMYENIDSIEYASLKVKPSSSQMGQPWRIEFDFVDTTLTNEGAFNVGQLYTSRRGTVLTQLKITFYAADDTTVSKLKFIEYEEHAYNASLYDAPLIWDSKTGILTAVPGETSQNSRFAFFRPTRGEIGKIVVEATTIASENGDAIDFAFATLTGVESGIPMYYLILLLLIPIALVLYFLAKYLRGRRFRPAQKQPPSDDSDRRTGLVSDDLDRQE